MKAYTTVKPMKTLLSVLTTEVSQYGGVSMCNAYLDEKGKMVKCGTFCPLNYR